MFSDVCIVAWLCLWVGYRGLLLCGLGLVEGGVGASPTAPYTNTKKSRKREVMKPKKTNSENNFCFNFDVYV